MSAFSTSEEAFAAEDLFDAYRSGDAAAVRAVAAKPLFKTIDNQVCAARHPSAACMLLCLCGKLSHETVMFRLESTIWMHRGLLLRCKARHAFVSMLTAANPRAQPVLPLIMGSYLPPCAGCEARKAASHRRSSSNG